MPASGCELLTRKDFRHFLCANVDVVGGCELLTRKDFRHFIPVNSFVIAVL